MFSARDLEAALHSIKLTPTRVLEFLGWVGSAALEGLSSVAPSLEGLVLALAAEERV